MIIVKVKFLIGKDENIKNTIDLLNTECIDTQDKITKTINRLKRMALNKGAEKDIM